MFTLEVENRYGQKLKLSQNESSYQILKIEGLTPPAAEIHTIVSANAHGSTYKAAKIEPRNIVLQIRPCGNIEENRLRLYEYFATSDWCKIYFRNNKRNIAIEGYVETIESDLFTNSQVLQISIVCPEPFFKDVSESVRDISKEQAIFEFPFEVPMQELIEFSAFNRDRFTCVVNYGEADTGCIIEIENISKGSIPIPVIRNYITGEYLKINGYFNAGEKVKINTNIGQKSVTKISNKGVESNILNDFNLNSTWLQLRKGANHFTYDYNSYDKFYRINIHYSSNYLGV